MQRRGRAGAVAHVGDGDLHGVFVHLDVVAEDLGADDGVLREVLRHAAADHEQAGGAGRDLDVGQFAEVGDRSRWSGRASSALIRSTWCLTRPKPAEQSVKAGQKIGTPSS